MNQADRSLESRFKAFLENLEGSESVDAPSFDIEFGQDKRADFLLNQRRIILELKSLEADPEYKVESRLGPHRKRSGFPEFFWKTDLNEILSHLPDGEDIRREIFHSVTRAVQSALEKADDQIQATKRVLGIPNACGVVAILNENVNILAPEFITTKASQILLKRKNGDVRYRHISYVWIISESHRLVSKAGMEHLPMVLLDGPTGNSHILDGNYINGLQAEWAKYLGMPFSDLGECENFDGLNFEKRSVESASSTDSARLARHEVWRRAYRHNPYLRSLSEKDFLKHTAQILEVMTPHFLKDGRKLENYMVASLIEGWTHALEEAEHRRLDMRKLQQWLPGLDQILK